MDPDRDDLVDRISAEREALARELYDLLRRRLPDLCLGTHPPAQVLAPLRYAVAHLVTHGAGERALGPDELRQLTAHVPHCVERGIAPGTLTAAYDLAGGYLLRRIRALARPGDRRVVGAVCGWVGTTLGQLAQQTRHAYAAAHMPAATLRRRRSLLAEALLAGTADVGEHARAAGITLPRAYLVVAATAADGPPPEAHPGTPADDILGRRHHDLLVWLAPTGGEGPGGRDFLADDLHAAISGAGAVYVGRAWRPTLAQVPDALAEAGTVARLLAATDRPGCGVLRDVVLELTLATGAEGGGDLDDVLTPLGEGPDLLETLSTLYANDLDRGRTASRLHLHRATLDYRLGRIRQLTGLDPLSVRGIRVLSSALDLRRMATRRPPAKVPDTKPDDQHAPGRTDGNRVHRPPAAGARGTVPALLPSARGPRHAGPGPAAPRRHRACGPGQVEGSRIGA